MQLRVAIDQVLAQALGRSHRDDEAVAPTGGPAGNARLTAWTGLLLLVLFLAELITILDVRSLISWHVAIGVLLIPPALLKTATTGWRIVRYYAGDRPYRAAGPPPMALRMLGPLVVVSTLAVLGSGVALLLMSPDSARRAGWTLGGFGLSVLMLHKATFVVWAVATGLHTLGRIVPALQLTTAVRSRHQLVPGRYRRLAALALTVMVAIGAAALALSIAGPWRQQPAFGPPPGHRHSRAG